MAQAHWTIQHDQHWLNDIVGRTRGFLFHGTLAYSKIAMRKWYELYETITECSKAKSKQGRITLDTQLKTAVKPTCSHVFSCLTPFVCTCFEF